MKRNLRTLTLRTLALWLGMGVSAHASPYFRLADPNHPVTAVGALADPRGVDGTDGATLLALITHSPKDGCLLPAVACENWTPLALGPSVHNGKMRVAIGPSLNSLPWAKAAVLAAVNGLTPDEDWQGLKALLAPAPDGSANLSLGPMFVLSPTENWKGYLRLWAGASWRF